MRLHHVEVGCVPGDEDRARALYRGALGIPEVEQLHSPAAHGGCWFRGDGVEIHVVVTQRFIVRDATHPALIVDDIDETAGRVLAAGFPVVWDGNLPGYRRFYTRDDSENQVQILAYR